jgi:heptaprenyl diphosphate synthase
MKRNSTRYLTFMAMMITLALILSYVETQIPAIPIPGAKIGLPNLVTLLVLVTLGFADAFVILIIRTTIISMLFTSALSLAYSLSGGILSLVAMYVILQVFKDRISIVATSLVGAVMHSVGQVLFAILIVDSFQIITLLPILILISIAAGLIVGYSAKFMQKHFQRMIK